MDKNICANRENKITSLRKTTLNFAWEACCFASSISRNMEINVKWLRYLNGSRSIYISLKGTDECAAIEIFK